MRIAIATDGDFVSAHFGRCPVYTLIDVEQGQVKGKEILDNPGHQPGAIPQFMNAHGVSCMIAGGMGMRAQDLFRDMGIGTVLGVSGKISEVVDKIKAGTLISGESLCQPGAGKGYGLDKSACDHGEEGHH